MTAYDVIVCGGGSAGLAAALSASRESARTLLVERHAALGGAGSNALVHTFCGLFHPDVSQGPQWLNPGIPTEIGQRLMALSHQQAPDLMGRVYVLRHEPTALARLALELCQQEPRLTVQTNATLTDVAHEAGQWLLTINAVQIAAKAIVDTTGDAAVARCLGKDDLWQTAPGDRLYRPAYVFSLQGVADPLDDATRLQVAALLVRAVKAGTLSKAALGATLRPSPQPGEVFISMDLEAGGADWDPLDTAKVSALERNGKTAALAIANYLREHHPAFALSPSPTLPVHVGIRESARWQGDYVLTAADLLSSRRFEDEIALAGWPLEMRESAKGPKFHYFDQPQPAGIPARCLRKASVPGLFFAGRCLSADHDALASVRVMGTCLATGQAAGRMAAHAV
ncbi:MAG: putative flavoprotein YhiN [Verrucomicrobiaceae bacterium]|nr:putative flavoprotein YhiN [Verrucomicrobiaceae bacterium]